jgi:hypothetical protein
VIYATHRREVGAVLREAHDECERLAASAN